jgi:MFS family permease
VTEWWSQQTGVLIGAIGGGGLGSLGGLLGAAMGCLAPRGKGKAIVIGAFGVFITLGVVSLAAGLAAMAQGQPYHVWFPALLIGAILTLVMGPLLPVALRAYRLADARRMEAEDLRRT